MLQSFYVIKEDGIGIFEYVHPKAKSKASIEFQLLAGLISALINFSKTTLMDNIQVIKLAGGKLVFSVEEKYPHRFGIGIYSLEDHDSAAKKANKAILARFNKKYPPEYVFPEIESAQEKEIDFDPLKSLYYLKIIPMTIPKNKFSVVFLSFLGLLIYFTLYSLYTSFFDNFLKYGITSQKTYYLIIIVFGLPYFVFGFISGQRYLGLFTTSIINTIFTMFVFLSYNTPISDIRIDGIDLTYFVAITAGFVGGYIAEFFFLAKKT